MSGHHFWQVIVGDPDYGDDPLTYYGPFDTFAEAKAWAMSYWPRVTIREFRLTRLVEEHEITDEEAASLPQHRSRGGGHTWSCVFSQTF